MKKRYYLAYGSNLNVRQMRYRCPDARIIGTSMIFGYRLMYKGSMTGSYLTIEKAPGYMVPVAVWEVSAEDEKNLDRYEGYPNFYYKQEVELDIIGIKTGKVRRRRCFVYIMHEERKLGIPHRSYIDTCMEGYRHFGFDEEYLHEALHYSWEGSVWKNLKLDEK